jgi:hypothetical protein
MMGEVEKKEWWPWWEGERDGCGPAADPTLAPPISPFRPSPSSNRKNLSAYHATRARERRRSDLSAPSRLSPSLHAARVTRSRTRDHLALLCHATRSWHATRSPPRARAREIPPSSAPLLRRQEEHVVVGRFDLI